MDQCDAVEKSYSTRAEERGISTHEGCVRAGSKPRAQDRADDVVRPGRLRGPHGTKETIMHPPVDSAYMPSL